jgi:hypothetical protein
MDQENDCSIELFSFNTQAGRMSQDGIDKDTKIGPTNQKIIKWNKNHVSKRF